MRTNKAGRIVYVTICRLMIALSRSHAMISDLGRVPIGPLTLKATICLIMEATCVGGDDSRKNHSASREPRLWQQRPPLPLPLVNTQNWNRVELKEMDSIQPKSRSFHINNSRHRSSRTPLKVWSKTHRHRQLRLCHLKHRPPQILAEDPIA